MQIATITTPSSTALAMQQKDEAKEEEVELNLGADVEEGKRREDGGEGRSGDEYRMVPLDEEGKASHDDDGGGGDGVGSAASIDEKASGHSKHMLYMLYVSSLLSAWGDRYDCILRSSFV